MTTHLDREAYAEAHIPGAAYADLDRDLAAPVDPSSGRHPLPDIDTATDSFRRLGISRNSRVVVYDSAGGAIAARMWWMLRWLGHVDPPPRHVFLTHGDEDVSLSLAERIRADMGWSVSVPEYLDSVELD